MKIICEASMEKQKLVRFETADAQAGGQRRPFAKAVRAGDFVYVSGQVPTIDGEVVTGGIVAQTEQVVANIMDVLALADCTLADVVKVNVWLDDARDFSSFNAVFQK
jgi:enamine deaminase RidA (YjgF/YER057c/UK114 family)